MAKNVSLVAERRTDDKKSSVKQLRKQGRVPGNVYGQAIDTESIPVHLPESEVVKLIHSGGARGIINLKVGNKDSYSVMLTEVQRNPIKDNLIHLDFIQVNLNEPVDVEVPIVLDGKAKGVAEGGILTPQARTVSIRCLPSAIPDSFHLDVESLEIGDTLTISALEIPEGMELLSDLDEVVASVQPPQLAPVDDAEDQDEPPAEINEPDDKNHPDQD